jgi:hypothetical protein
MSSAEPRTTSSAAAVITSRAFAAASSPNIGLSSQRPAAISARSDPSAMPTCSTRPPGTCRFTGRQKGDECQQRHDHQVFEQQDGDRLLPGLGRCLAPLVQHLHDDGRRRQHEAGAGHEGDQQRQVEQQHAGAGEERRAEADLRHSKAEDFFPEPPETRRLHFQADDEEEHHDAEFSDVQDRLRIGEEPEAERPDDQARGEVTKYGAEPEPLEQGARR